MDESAIYDLGTRITRLRASWHSQQQILVDMDNLKQAQETSKSKLFKYHYTIQQMFNGLLMLDFSKVFQSDLFEALISTLLFLHSLYDMPKDLIVCLTYKVEFSNVVFDRYYILQELHQQLGHQSCYEVFNERMSTPYQSG